MQSFNISILHLTAVMHKEFGGSCLGKRISIVTMSYFYVTFVVCWSLMLLFSAHWGSQYCIKHSPKNNQYQSPHPAAFSQLIKFQVNFRPDVSLILSCGIEHFIMYLQTGGKYLHSTLNFAYSIKFSHKREYRFPDSFSCSNRAVKA